MDVQVIGVIGAGTMGSGIAQAAATAGFQVGLYDANGDAIERAMTSMAARVAREVRKGRMTQEQSDTLLQRIKPVYNVRAFENIEFVIEAATEKLEVKQAVFRQLDAVCPLRTVFATNTSGLSITEIASATSRPDLFVGMHFFNPVPVMKLVEIIRGSQTSDEAIDIAHDVSKRLGKEAIFVKEAPLFVVNRILVPMINEAILVLQEGLSTAEDIDKGMMLGANHPIGPLALADMVGLDTLLFVAETLYNETSDSKYRPALLLKQMVRAGRLGRKSGAGFYSYDSNL